MQARELIDIAIATNLKPGKDVLADVRDRGPTWRKNIDGRLRR